MANQIRILITGISGSNISDFANKCVAAGNKVNGQNWSHISFKELVKKQDLEASSMADDQWEDSILKRGAVHQFRRAAMKDLLSEVEKRSERTDNNLSVVLITMHITFRNGKILLPGLDLSKLSELYIDVFVSVVDDILDVWSNLRKLNQERWREVGPIDLLEWREFEVFLTEQLAQYSGVPKPFYIFPRNQNVQTLVDAINYTEKARYYRSYPITFVASRPNVQKEADRVGDELEKIAIVFDPLGIKDIERKNELKELYEIWCKELDQKPSETYWREVVLLLEQQTVTRDHRLINQSNGIVVFYPELEYFQKKSGKYEPETLVPFSSGVLDEMHYATQLGKKVYLIWPAGKNPGPFLPLVVTRKFESLESLLAFLKKAG